MNLMNNMAMVKTNDKTSNGQDKLTMTKINDMTRVKNDT